MRVAVFSGRFDPPHMGHYMTISRLAKNHEIVIVPVLNYPGRLISAYNAVGIFNESTINNHGSFIWYIVNDTHFAKIPITEYDNILKFFGIDQKINNVTYYSGNNEVLQHMKSVGIKCEFVERSYDKYYHSTMIKESVKNAK